MVGGKHAVDWTCLFSLRLGRIRPRVGRELRSRDRPWAGDAPPLSIPETNLSYISDIVYHSSNVSWSFAPKDARDPVATIQSLEFSVKVLQGLTLALTCPNPYPARLAALARSDLFDICESVHAALANLGWPAQVSQSQHVPVATPNRNHAGQQVKRQPMEYGRGGTRVDDQAVFTGNGRRRRKLRPKNQRWWSTAKPCHVNA